MSRPKIKRPPKLNFEINLTNYLLLIKVAFLHPLAYVDQIPESKNLIKPLTFYTANVGISYLLAAVWDQFSNLNHPSIFFALSQLVLLVPLITLSLLVSCSILFAIARLLKGKASFKQTFNILCYSFLPVIFLNLPYINLIAFLWMLFLAISGFQRINQYPILSAIINIILPVLIIALLGVILGVIGSLRFSVPL